MHPNEKLSAYLDGELGARERERIEQHLAACPTCASELRALRHARETFVAHAPRVESSDSHEFFWSQLKKRIEQAAPAPLSRPFWVQIPRWAYATVSVAMLAIVISVYFFRTSAPIPIVSEVENVQTTLPNTVATPYKSAHGNAAVIWISGIWAPSFDEMKAQFGGQNTI
jgi:anti-sigma-K factor RskA